MSRAKKILTHMAIWTTITIVCFSVAASQSTAFLYVFSYCLVKTSFLRDCETQSKRDEPGVQRCFLPVWLIEHKVSGNTQQGTIVGSKFLVHDNDVGHDTEIMKLHEVDICLNM